MAHPFGRAIDMLSFFRDACADLPDEMMLVADLQTAPDGSKIAAIVAAHSGSLREGDAAVRPLKAPPEGVVVRYEPDSVMVRRAGS